MAGSHVVLVTGANGFVGRALVNRLANDGIDVIAGTRTSTSHGTGIAHRTWPDIDAVDWQRELRGVDVIVHSAARTHVRGREARFTTEAFRKINVQLTCDIARGAADAGCRRLVYLSSAHVNGSRTTGEPFTAHTPPHPQNCYARSKWEAEQCLADIARSTGLEIVIIRPPLVLGRSPKGNLGTLVAAMRSGIPMPFGSVLHNRRDLVSLETLADLVSRAIVHPDAPGPPLMVSDGNPLSTRAIVERLATLHDLTPRLIPAPPRLLERMLQLSGRANLASQLLGSLEIDISETCRRLDWHPSMRAVR